MPACPTYRIRLFLSVDLVGSTAFKAKYGDRRDDGEPYPIWLRRTKTFYHDFPKMLAANYANQLHVVSNSASFADRIPQVWKTVGDEIIFCVRLTCLEHLAVCTKSFVSTLGEYGDLLQTVEGELDVKGCAWTAAFPAPNVTIVAASRISTVEASSRVGSQLEEMEELEADVKPGDYDFLGKNIDTGFRISKFAEASQLALSIELAWLLMSLRHLALVDFNFSYHGKESLKGVINNSPYPVVTIETERSETRRELYAFERNVNREGFADHIALRDYLLLFMREHRVDVPVLQRNGETISSDALPRCFHEFSEAWANTQIETEERTRTNDDAQSYDDITIDDTGGMSSESDLQSATPDIIKEFLAMYAKSIAKGS